MTRNSQLLVRPDRLDDGGRMPTLDIVMLLSFADHVDYQEHRWSDQNFGPVYRKVLMWLGDVPGDLASLQRQATRLGLVGDGPGAANQFLTERGMTYVRERGLDVVCALART